MGAMHGVTEADRAASDAKFFRCRRAGRAAPPVRSSVARWCASPMGRADPEYLTDFAYVWHGAVVTDAARRYADGGHRRHAVHVKPYSDAQIELLKTLPTRR